MTGERVKLLVGASAVGLAALGLLLLFAGVEILGAVFAAPTPEPFPAILGAMVAGVYGLRLEVVVQGDSAIYFSSGTADQVLPIESTLLLPAIFLVVVALFAALAQRMGREMAAGCRIRHGLSTFLPKSGIKKVSAQSR